MFYLAFVLRLKVSLLETLSAPDMPGVGKQFSNWANKIWFFWRPNKELMSTSQVAAAWREEGAGASGNSGR